MKKQTISKVAALSLAALTAVPMLGMVASADVSIHYATASSNVDEVTGTAYKITWYTTENVKKYLIKQDAVTGQFSITQTNEVNGVYRGVNDATELGDQVGGGEKYYAYSSIKPADYVTLSDSVNVMNTNYAKTNSDMTKAVANYNNDLTKYKNTVETMKGRPNVKKPDGTETVATTTYKDSLGNTVTVNNLGSAEIDKNGTVTAYTGPAASDYNADLSDGYAFGIAKYTVVTDNRTLTMAQLAAELGTSYITVANGTGIIDMANNGDPGAFYLNTGSGTSTNTDNIASSATYSSTYHWYSLLTKRYYKTSADATAASGGSSAYVYDASQNMPSVDSSATYSSTYHWYSSYTRRYYKTYSDAVSASNGSSAYVSDASTTSPINSSASYSSTYHWYSSLTRRYYKTYSDALTDSNGVASYVSDASSYSDPSSSTYSSTYHWYSSYTRRYYQTYAAALAASNGNSSYVSQGNIYDPYSYYYALGGFGGLGGTTTTTNRDTSSVTIGNQKGWNAVTRTINSARSGASYTVNMKNETEIPSSVLSALKGKNVDVNFKFSNGSVVTLNGSDIDYTSTISPVIQYGSTSIPSSLKKKAVQSNDGVSSSQLTINGGSLGASASVTVKFNEKRSGCSAKLYRYNPSANTLSLVSRSSVGSNGRCTFDNVKQGGEYIVVLS